MKKEYTEKEKKELALTLASMLGHYLNPGNYTEGLYETIRQYEGLTGDKSYNEIIPKAEAKPNLLERIKRFFTPHQ